MSLIPRPARRHALTKNLFFAYEAKMTDAAKAAINRQCKIFVNRDSYKNYMDGSDWKTVLMRWEEIVLPSIQASIADPEDSDEDGDGDDEDGEAVPRSWPAGAVAEATVLFNNLRIISVICGKSRQDLTEQDCDRCKMASFAYCRLVESLNADGVSNSPSSTVSIGATRDTEHLTDCVLAQQVISRTDASTCTSLGALPCAPRRHAHHLQRRG